MPSVDGRSRVRRALLAVVLGLLGALASNTSALFSERPLIAQLAARHRVPAVYETCTFVDVGGLLSYGPLNQERFQRMASYVDRILRGARPGDLPIERPTIFELVINLKAAEALGLTIPQPLLLLRADEVIR